MAARGPHAPPWQRRKRWSGSASSPLLFSACGDLQNQPTTQYKQLFFFRSVFNFSFCPWFPSSFPVADRAVERKRSGNWLVDGGSAPPPFLRSVSRQIFLISPSSPLLQVLGGMEGLLANGSPSHPYCCCWWTRSGEGKRRRRLVHGG